MTACDATWIWQTTLPDIMQLRTYDDSSCKAYCSFIDI
jgi:hypothetical protein